MGSGKTWRACIRLLLHAWHYGGLSYGAVTTSAAQWDAVVGATLNRHLDRAGLPPLKRRGDWWEIPAPKGYRPCRLYRLLGSNRESEKRLRGHNLAGVLIDEVTEMPGLDYVRMVWSRVRDPRCDRPVVLMTTNPSGPDHWALTEIAAPIQNGLVAGRVELWRPHHNPALTPDALADLEATYPEGTVGHRRYILGEWVAQEGAIYPSYLIDEAIQPEWPGGQPDGWAVSVDVGYSVETHAILWGRWGMTWVAVDEWVYAGGDDRQLIASEQIKQALRQFRGFAPDLREKLRLLVVDPSPGGPEGWAQSAKTLLASWPVKVVGADKSRVVPGIELVRRWLGTGRLKFRGVPQLVSALRRYRWADPTVTGVERPVQVEDHGPDAVRYLVATVCKLEGRGGGTWMFAGGPEVPGRPMAGDVVVVEPLV